jgi:hypothetical protein
VLDQICAANPGVVAHVEWHVNSSYPYLYSSEAKSKWFVYPDHGGYYYYATLYIDGRDRGTSAGLWENYIYNQFDVPSEVSLTNVGTTYNPATLNGQLRVECYNSGADSISAALQFAITEDSINYSAPNGDAWHNAVCRDYVPNQYGTAVALGAGARDTITVSYTLQPSWVEERVKLVVYLQKTSLQGDTLATYQGLSDNVLKYVGVEESKLLAARDLRVSVSPNPCRTGCEFALSGAAAHGARITIYTPDGRLVSSLDVASNRATWGGAARGMYLYRVNAGTATAEGKLVVTD